jgi:signal transduction histidine kinase
MTPPGQWLRPPRTLLLALFVVTLVAVSALVWFGGSLLNQERVVEAQHAQERQEQAADRIATKFREALAETGERLGYWVLNPPSDGTPTEGVLLTIDGTTVSAMPRRRLLYRPLSAQTPLPGAEASDDVFADGEALEFQQAEPDKAIEWYRRLADSKDPAVGAGALIRMARVLRKARRVDEARSAYLRAAAIRDARIDGIPAELLARVSLLDLPHKIDSAQRLLEDLLDARWSLSRGQFEFYWSEVSRRAESPVAIPAERMGLSEAIGEGWKSVMRDESPRGQTAIWIAGSPWLLIWSGTPEHRAILAARPESVFTQILSGENVTCALADVDGRILLGRRGDIAHATVRTAAETRLPWTLYIRSASGAAERGMIARQRFLMLITSLTVLFLLSGAYFIARAIRTEAQVFRMQADFVAAVSHEFRSPLTSMRQLSEILALGRVANEDRRQVYYETLVRETMRLQRLIEGLLNFGRMEAGVRKFHFEQTDPARLIAGIAAEFEPRIAGTGRRIEITPGEDVCSIDADPEALAVALRNLVDNALKYAPETPAVWLECGVEKGRVAIRVRDQGPGIPRSERKTIFRKFVRGSAASAGNVKGSGIGLAMVRHIVAVHRGDVRLTSEVGAGSTFTILLPRGAKST